MTHACETNCLHDSSFHHTPCKLLLKCSTDRQQTAMLSTKIVHLVCPRHRLCRMYHMQLHYTLAQLRAAGSGGSHTIAERQTFSFSFLCIGSAFPACRPLIPLMGPMNTKRALIDWQVQADVRTIISKDFATRHSLRFPRVERIRYDKSPFDVQTDQELWDLVNQNKGVITGKQPG